MAHDTAWGTAWGSTRVPAQRQLPEHLQTQHHPHDHTACQQHREEDAKTERVMSTVATFFLSGALVLALSTAPSVGHGTTSGSVMAVPLRTLACSVQHTHTHNLFLTRCEVESVSEFSLSHIHTHRDGGSEMTAAQDLPAVPETGSTQPPYPPPYCLPCRDHMH